MLRLAHAAKVERAVLCAAALLCGCIAGSPGDGNAVTDAGAGQSLEQACADSCTAQFETDCAGVETVDACTTECVMVRNYVPECVDAWTDLNACTSVAQLFCDRVNGGAAANNADCELQMNAYLDCTD